MRNSTVALVFSATLTLGLGGLARAGTNGLDERFGTGGIVLLGPPVDGPSYFGIAAIVALGDGKVLVGGRASDDAGEGMGSILPAVGRLNADGSWDTAFGDNGLFVLPYGTASAPYGGVVNHLALTSAGGIVASGGTYTNLSGFSQFETCSLLIKLNDAGAIDTGFASDHSGSLCFEFAPNTSDYHPSAHYEGLQVDTDDNIYLTTPTTNGACCGAVARLDTAGNLVSTWGSNGIATLPTGVNGVLLRMMPDHGLMVGAVHELSIVPSSQTIATIRLDSSGSPDATYGTQGEFDFPIQTDPAVSPASAEFDASGALLVASADYNQPFTLARCTDAGVADPGFNGSAQQLGASGIAYLDLNSEGILGGAGIVYAHPMVDGHIFATGDRGSSHTTVALIRLNGDSSYDTTFGDAAHPGWSTVDVGGSDTSYTFATAFAADTSSHAFISIYILNDANGKSCAGLVRVIPDRLSDSGFESAAAMPTCPQAQ